VKTVGCPDARSVRSANCLSNERAQLKGRDGIEPGRGLVEEQQLGLENEETGERNATLLPETELMTRTLQQMVDAQGLRHLAGSASRLAWRGATAKQTPGNVLGNRACDEVVFRVLAEKGHASVEPGAERRIGRHVVSEARHGPLRGSVEPREQAQQARLPGPTWSKHEQPLCSFEAKFELLEHEVATAFDVDGIEVDAVMSPNVFAGGTTQQCVLLGAFEAREGVQGAFAKQRSPSGDRQAR